MSVEAANDPQSKTLNTILLKKGGGARVGKKFPYGAHMGPHMEPHMGPICGPMGPISGPGPMGPTWGLSGPYGGPAQAGGYTADGWLYRGRADGRLYGGLGGPRVDTCELALQCKLRELEKQQQKINK